jgi:hypothetical protein
MYIIYILTFGYILYITLSIKYGTNHAMAITLMRMWIDPKQPCEALTRFLPMAIGHAFVLAIME